MNTEIERSSQNVLVVSVKDFLALIIPVILLLSVIIVLIPESLVEKYVMLYKILMPLIAFSLAIKVYYYHRDLDFGKTILFFSVSILMVWISGIIWTVYVLNGLDPFPSIADIVYLFAYAPLIYMCLRSLRSYYAISFWIIPAILAVAGVLFFAVFFPLLAVAMASSNPIIELLILLAYPLLDIIVFILVMLILAVFYQKKIEYFWLWTGVLFLLFIEV